MRTAVRLLGPAALAALLLLSGCAGHRTPQTQPMAQGPALSPEGRVQYYYLIYQDQILRLQRLTRTQPLNQETLALALGYQKTAVEALNKVIELSPAPELYLDKANLFWNNDQIGMARGILEEGVQRFPDDRTLNLYLANALLMEGKIDRAAQVFDGYVERFPKDDQARVQYAQVLVDLREYARALDALKALPPKALDAEARFLQAQAQSGLGQHRQALRTLRGVLAADPEDIDALGLMAYQYEMLKDYAAAEKTYARLLAIDESRDEVRLRLATLNLKLNRPDRALALIRDGSRERGALLEAAEVFLREGFPAQASAVLELLAESGPVSAEFYLYQAMIAFEGRGDAEKALKVLENIQETDPGYPQALQFRIQLLAALKRHNEALEAAAEGVRRYPGLARFYILEAGLLAESKELPKAREIMEQGLARMPGDADLHYRYGLLLREMGDETGALSAMEQAILKNPEHAEALNYLGYTLADENRELDRALVLVQSALRQDPENGFMIDSLAWVYFRMGRLDEAWTQIRRAVSLVPDDPEIWNHYGDIAKAMGKTNEARRAYTTALKKKHKDPELIQGKLRGL